MLIMAAGIFSSTMCELLTWFLVYRKEDFKILKSKLHVIQTKSRS